jgi:hypothetical protein
MIGGGVGGGVGGRIGGGIGRREYVERRENAQTPNAAASATNIAVRIAIADIHTRQIKI